MNFKSMNELLEQPTFTIRGRTVKAPNYAAAELAVEDREEAERRDYIENHESLSEIEAGNYNDDEEGY